MASISRREPRHGKTTPTERSPRSSRASSRCSLATLDATLEILLDRRPYFSYWDERLQDALGEPNAAMARAMLAVCAQAPEGATPDAMNQSIAALVPELADRARAFKWILDVLMNDGYLVQQDGRWRFRSGLLRRYWMRHVV
jgi:hypothetical protein